MDSEHVGHKIMSVVERCPLSDSILYVYSGTSLIRTCLINNPKSKHFGGLFILHS